MASFSLMPFQENGTKRIAQKLTEVNSVLSVSPTGSGKAVIIATIAYRYIMANPGKDVCIFVHRRELLDQIREKLFAWYAMISQLINADTIDIRKDARIYCCMVETFDRRAKDQSFLNYFANTGLICIDEAHFSHFNKIFLHFNSMRIGFTATPVSAKKKDPLKNYYKDIVVLANIKQLIELNDEIQDRGVVRCQEYSLKNIIRSSFKKKGEDFDEKQVAEELSKKEQIQNTIHAAQTIGFGCKTFCFNVNIDHSVKMNKAFLDAGFNSRHMDSDSKSPYGKKEWRIDCWKWFKSTPDAILNNIGIATVGTDEPSVERVITNKLTLSMPLLWQMRGRGGRPHIFKDGRVKEFFYHLDMGDNVEGGGLGRYDDDVDWEFAFNNPKLPIPGVSAVKTCPECGALQTASSRICTALVNDWLTSEKVQCGFEFTIAKEKEEDTIPKEMVRITADISVKANIDAFKDKKPYYSMYILYTQIANKCKNEIEGQYLDSRYLDSIIELAQNKISEWHKLMSKRKFPNFKKEVKKTMIEELRKFNFIITAEEIRETEDLTVEDETEDFNFKF